MPPTARNADHYALVIGVDNYPLYRPLQGAVRDARDFAKWLCEEPQGGGVPSENCKAIYSTSNPLTPLQEPIDEALDAIFTSIPRQTMARRLYVYFSGHGMAPTNLETHLCLANWAERFPNRALDSKEYLDAVMNLGKFEEVIMLFDCCRVRLVSAHGYHPGFLVAAPGQGAPRARYFTAYAAEFLNSAYEAATAVGPPDQDPLVRGYFTRALMAALRGGAACAAGGVLTSDLKRYLENNIPKLAQADGYVQNPEIANGLNGDPVFGSAQPTPPAPPSAAVQPAAPPSSRGGSKSSHVFTLTLHDPIGVKSVSLFDQQNKSIFQGAVGAKKKFSLAPGLFKVRTQFAHTVLETPVDLNQNVRLSTFEQLQTAPPTAGNTMQFYTAAPLSGRPTSHEYYTYTSEYWSKNPTRGPLRSPRVRLPVDSSLFIFIRAVDQSMYDRKGDLGKDLLLLDSSARPVSDFSVSETHRDTKYGWLAFHVGGPSGIYYLRFRGEPARDIPIQMYRGWQTQIFLIYRSKPLFETMKIFLGKKELGFVPNDDQTQAIDLALNDLQNNQSSLSEGSLRLLLHAKFLNPMLGLVGAHVVLRRQESLSARLRLEGRKPNPGEHRQQEADRRLVKIVLRNLSRLLPGSSDVAALTLLAARSLGRTGPTVPFDRPPMLRPGLQAVLAEAALRPSIIGRDSSLPQIASRIYVDTPWSTWKPLSVGSTKADLDWVHLAILDSVSTLKSKTAGDKAPSISELAKRLGLPQQTVMRAAKDLDNASASVLRRAVPAEYKSLIAGIRRKSRSQEAQSPRGLFSATLRRLAGFPSSVTNKERSARSTTTHSKNKRLS